VDVGEGVVVQEKVQAAGVQGVMVQQVPQGIVV
jgi:hypothetical protein